VKLCSFYSSKSVLDDVAHLYLAEDLRPVTRAGDDTEFIEIRPFPLDEVVRMVERSEIVDAMTVIAVLHAVRRR
jgi:ADP-ribose pyrophosphatase